VSAVIYETSDTTLEMLAQVLRRVRFPATREEIAREASRQGADGPLIARLHNLPPDSYDRATHVMQAVMLLTPDGSRSDQAQR